MQSPLAVRGCILILRQQIAELERVRGEILRHIATLQGLLGSIDANCPMRADCLRRRKKLLERLAAAIAELQGYIDQIDQDLTVLWNALSRCEQGIEPLPGVGVSTPGTRGGSGWTWIGSAYVHSFERAIKAFQKSCRCNFSLVPVRPVYIHE